jgi:catechol 2,3-dioxygenase-like lactoylglutathione lyase family enzyme
MTQRVGIVTVLVKDYDEAIAYFTKVLGFQLVEDTDLGIGKRWVVVTPAGQGGVSLLLARATNPDQEKRIGDQTGGRVFLFLYSDDFWVDYNEMLARGVQFLEAPRKEDYGLVVVFQDLYGNRWDFLEMRG